MSEINIIYTHITDIYDSPIPKRIGVYVITHTLNNIYAEKYVVSSKNLYNRFNDHYNKEIIYIDLYITDDIFLAQSLERILMDLIKPSTNIEISPLSDKDKELMKELLEDTKIKEYTFNDIVKIGYRYLKYNNRTNIRKINKIVEKKRGAIPLSNELIELVKKRQLELSNERGKIVTLTEVSNEIVKRGIESINRENISKETSNKKDDETQ